jgi:hypothetical protein
MTFPRAADDTCTSFGATANPTVSNQNATLKLPAKKVRIQITHTRQNFASQEERDGETKEGTLSPCRKTAAASRDEDNTDTSKMETLFLKVRTSIFGNDLT